ncbi:MAG: LuxR C-terminal-related transcriptional regulator [Coriobacteriaceae bacterium]|nr:LuxR C-terminal-related transcriptional regulator [Coriobacteriaceae bacterium]
MDTGIIGPDPRGSQLGTTCSRGSLISAHIVFITDAENDQSAWGSLRPTGEADERPYLAPAIASITQAAELTNRQRDVLEGLCRPRTKSQIADDPVISKETVKMHARNVYAAFDVHSQQELCALVAEREARLRHKAEE